MSIVSWRRIVVFILTVAMSFRPLSAQGSRVSQSALQEQSAVIQAARVNVPIRIDGRLSEPVWRAVRPAERFIQREPVAGASATHATEVRMVLTDDAVVIGARLHDDPGALFDRGTVDGDGALVGYLADYFEVQIDPHRAHVTALAVSVAPCGSRRSSIVATDGTRDESWDVHWEAATHLDADGWSVEIRIPLSEFHIKPGDETWGVQFVRFSWQRQETDVFRYVPTRYF